MPPRTKVVVRLTPDPRLALQRLTHAGSHPAHTLTRARVLLKADAHGPDAWPDERIAAALDVCRMTVMRVRQRFAAEGLDATLHKSKPTGRQYRRCRPAPGRRPRRDSEDMRCGTGRPTWSWPSSRWPAAGRSS